MTEDFKFVESADDFPDCGVTVTSLIQRLKGGNPPDNWEHDIAYNYLVHQGTVLPMGVQAFPHLLALTRQASLETETRHSLTHLCAHIFLATSRSADARAALLNTISELIQSASTCSDKVHLISSYARVAAGDELLADSIQNLVDITCPNCGKAVVATDDEMTDE